MAYFLENKLDMFTRTQLLMEHRATGYKEELKESFASITRKEH